MPAEPDRSQVTEILDALERGEERSARDLLPLVYDELRRLAAPRLAHERPGQTLQPTALVHEAYLRLVGGDPAGPGTAAATSSPPPPRRCGASSSNRARGKAAQKHGGSSPQARPRRHPADVDSRPDLSLALDEALTSSSGTTRRPRSSSSSATSPA